MMMEGWGEEEGTVEMDPRHEEAAREVALQALASRLLDLELLVRGPRPPLPTSSSAASPLTINPSSTSTSSSSSSSSSVFSSSSSSSSSVDASSTSASTAPSSSTSTSSSLLGASPSSSSSSSLPLAARLAELDQTLRRLEATSIPNLAACHRKYMRLRARTTWEEEGSLSHLVQDDKPAQVTSTTGSSGAVKLQRSGSVETTAGPSPAAVDAALSGSFAGIAAKAAIACSYEDEAAEVARYTAQISSLLGPLQAPKAIGPEAVATLARLENIHFDQLEASSILATRFNRLLDGYNDTMNMLSAQFLQWHHQLSELEEKLGINPQADPLAVGNREEGTSAPGHQPEIEDDTF